jgi:DNA polymerase-3 subunit alpha
MDPVIEEVLPPKQFVGTHGHSHFSIADGLGLPQEHIDFVLENGMDAWSLTDHGNMNGYCHGHSYAKELNKKGRKFKFVGGVEAYYHPDLAEWRRYHEQAKADRIAAKKKTTKAEEGEDLNITLENEDESKDASKWFDPVRRRHHLVLLPTTRRGLENIFKMVSRSFKEGFYRFPRIDRAMLKQHGEDVLVTSACISGPLAYDVMHELRDLQGPGLTAAALDDEARMGPALARAMNTYDQLADAVGREHVFAELQFNALPQQHVVNRVLLEMHRRHGVPLTAAADSHYCRPELWAEREIYKMLGRLNYDQIDPSVLPKSPELLKCELYPKNAGQMWDAYRKHCAGWSFYDDALVRAAIEDTWNIAHDMIGTVEPDVGIKLPTSLVQPGRTPMQMLVEMCKDGMVRMGLHMRPAYVQRLKHELSVLRQIHREKGKDFSLYFVTQRIITEIAERTQLIGCGRGSAAGSLINYVLGITSVDPIRFGPPGGLYFERFLNPARAEMPDIDCVSSAMCVATPAGARRIDELRVGDPILDLEGETQRVLAVATRTVDADRDVVYDVFVRFDDGGYGSLRCNHRHVLFSADRREIKVADLRLGSLLAGERLPVVVGRVEVDACDVQLTDITVSGGSSFRILPFDVIEITDPEPFLISVNKYDLDTDQAGEIVDAFLEGRRASDRSVVRI